MTTALQMITTAGRRMGEFASGESLTADEVADGLATLNSMLDAWAINRLMVYQIVQEVFSTVASTASYTIGSSGAWNTTRPARLDDSSFLRISGIDYPLELVPIDSYAGVSAKSNTSNIPNVIAFDNAYPLATIFLYPTPSAVVSVYLRSWKALQSFSSLSTDLAMPPGYQRAIEWNLCAEMCPEYGRKVTPDIMRNAVSSKAAIAAINAPSLIMTNEAAYNRFRDQSMNIYQG